MTGRELNKTEIKVLNLITNRASFEEPIKAEKNQTRNRTNKAKS